MESTTIINDPKRLLDQRKDFLNYKSSECQGILHHFEPSLDLHSFIDMKCSFSGCNYRNQRRYLSDHERSCPYRNVLCRYCFNEEKISFLYAHEHFFCHKRPIQCGNKYCSEMIPLNLMINHKSVCLFEFVDGLTFQNVKGTFQAIYFHRCTRAELFEHTCNLNLLVKDKKLEVI